MGTVLSDRAGTGATGRTGGPYAPVGEGPRHAAAAPPQTSGRGGTGKPAAPEGAFARLRSYLPRGNTLDEATFQRRHLFLCWVLGLHVPALFVMGVVRGYGVAHVALELVVPTACVAFARLSINRRLASFFVTAGLVYCSAVLVHLSGGMIEAHFHFFILIGLIALYQDWVPFVWDVAFTVLSHGVGSSVGAKLIFNHDAGQSRPWTWAVIHGSAVLAACVAQVILWKNTEDEQARSLALVGRLAQADVERRDAMSQLLVNLARRNQSLLNRQLEVIAELEQREDEPAVLEELFRLDHLATRIRRNAESLLVLSGDDPPRRWASPVPLSDVVRAAAAEVEDYRRVNVLVDEHLDVAGRAVSDLAHLIAELVENAATFSPPTSEVRVRSHLSPGEPVTFVVSIEDSGIGMSEDDLREANRLLADVPEVDLRRATLLGFHVVARLSARYGISVHLAPTPGGGLTALVILPTSLLSERPGSLSDVAGAPNPAVDRYQRAAAAWTDAHARGPLRRQMRERQDRSQDAVDMAPISAMAPGPSTEVRWVPAPIPAPPPKPDWWFASEPLATSPSAPIATTGTPIPAPSWLLERGAEVAEAADVRPEPPDKSDRSVWWAVLASPDGQLTGPSATLGAPPPVELRAPADTAAPAAPGDAVTGGSEILARRVPGTHLSPALRRGGAPHPASAQPPDRDPERVRSMLSRFQASQRAGRAADPGAPDPPQEGR
jgi:signal transduction histidine kinase